MNVQNNNFNEINEEEYDPNKPNDFLEISKKIFITIILIYK